MIRKRTKSDDGDRDFRGPAHERRSQGDRTQGQGRVQDAAV